MRELLVLVGICFSTLRGKVEPKVQRLAAIGRSFPRGFENALWFSTLQIFSIQILVSSPMILFAQKLGAGPSILVQLAGVRILDRRGGHRTFVVGGWKLRIAIFLGLALLLVFLGIFNLSRWLSLTGWMPWLTGLLPPSIQGSHLAWETALVDVASFVAFLISAFWVDQESQNWQFSFLFIMSAFASGASAFCQDPLPDIPRPAPSGDGIAGVGWRQILSDREKGTRRNQTGAGPGRGPVPIHGADFTVLLGMEYSVLLPNENQR